MREIDSLLSVEDPVKRKALFMALFSKEVVSRGGRQPVIVGGEAVELYTQGSYTTGDIDIKSPPEITESVLKEWGFSKAGRTWLNKDLDIYIDWLGASLEEGEEAERRLTTIQLGEGLEIAVISIEDLLIDRLKAYKWWDDKDSLLWARVLVSVKRSIGEVEESYLRERARKAGLSDILEKILSLKE